MTSPLLIGDGMASRAEEQKPNVTELVERLRADADDLQDQWEGLGGAHAMPTVQLIRQAASTLTSQAEEIERQKGRVAIRDGECEAKAQIATLTTRIGELEGALRPFARLQSGSGKNGGNAGAYSLLFTDIIKARAALTKEPT
jgi:hypothetical protein